MIRGAIVVMLVAMAGCLDPQGTGHDQVKESEPPAPDGPLPTPDPMEFPRLATPYPEDAFWNGCKGAGVAFEWLGEHERFKVPPAWGSDAGRQQLTHTNTLFIKCDRLSWGAFERSVSMVLDVTGIDVIPDDCRRKDVTIVYTKLQTIWANDTEVVDFLREVYGMPAYYAEIETAWESLVVPEFVWTMTHEDGAVSMFRMADDGQRNDSYDYAWFRSFWFNASATSYMDWGLRDWHSGPAPGQVHAENPLTLSYWHTQEPPVYGNILVDTSILGELGMYRDLLCTDKIS